MTKDYPILQGISLALKLTLQKVLVIGDQKLIIRHLDVGSYPMEPNLVSSFKKI